MKFTDIRIKAVGSYMPVRVMTNQELEKGRPTSHKWITENLGIHERRIANDDETVAYMGMRAAMKAFVDYDISPSTIDAVIVSCSSTSHNAPSIACQIINMIGIQVPAFDINAVCSGFVYALEMGCMMIKSGVYKNVLIIATEKYSSNTDWTSRDCVYFGDGAGATIISEGSGDVYINLYADGKSDDAFVSPTGDKYTIVGNKVAKKATDVLPEAVKKILKEANVTPDAITYLIPHQAGLSLLRNIVGKMGIAQDKAVYVMDAYANIASASIPIALSKVWSNSNMTLLLMTIGSGWTWGTAVIRQR